MNSLTISVAEMPVEALAGTIAGFLRHHGLRTNKTENGGNQLIHVAHEHHVVWIRVSPEKHVAVIEGRSERELSPDEVKTIVSMASATEDVLQVLWPIDPEVRYRSAVGMVS